MWRDLCAPSNLAFVGAGGATVYAIGVVEAVLLSRGRAPLAFALKFAAENALASLIASSRRAGVICRSLGLDAEAVLIDAAAPGSAAEATRVLRAETLGTVRRLLGAFLMLSEAAYVHERRQRWADGCLAGAVAPEPPQPLRLSSLAALDRRAGLDGAGVLPVLAVERVPEALARRLTDGGRRAAFLNLGADWTALGVAEWRGVPTPTTPTPTCEAFVVETDGLTAEQTAHARVVLEALLAERGLPARVVTVALSREAGADVAVSAEGVLAQRVAAWCLDAPAPPARVLFTDAVSAPLLAALAAALAPHGWVVVRGAADVEAGLFLAAEATDVRSVAALRRGGVAPERAAVVLRSRCGGELVAAHGLGVQVFSAPAIEQETLRAVRAELQGAAPEEVQAKWHAAVSYTPERTDRRSRLL